jgi:hypothetical protein
VQGMLAAKFAEFLYLKFAGLILFILGNRVVAIFAFFT